MSEQAEAPKGTVPEDANERKHSTKLHTNLQAVTNICKPMHAFVATTNSDLHTYCHLDEC